MHCRACGYSLWNLSAPRCPECGTGFDIRQFAFRPGTVGFACPHCGHLHGGKGDRYLPAETPQATCLGCGQAMDVVAMRPVLLVDDPRQAEAAAADTLPWEERHHLGFWRGWRQTWTHNLGRPTRTGQAMLLRRSWLEAFWFAVLSCLVSHVPLGAAASLGLVALMVASYSSNTGSLSVSWYWWLWWLLVGPLIGAFLSVAQPLLFVLTLALPGHLYLRAVGPTNGSLGLTTRAVLYAQPPMLFAAGLWGASMLCCCMPTPILLPVFYLWPALAAVFTVAAAQRVKISRALPALFWLPALLGLTAAGLLALALMLKN